MSETLGILFTVPTSIAFHRHVYGAFLKFSKNEAKIYCVARSDSGFEKPKKL